MPPPKYLWIFYLFFVLKHASLWIASIHLSVHLHHLHVTLAPSPSQSEHARTIASRPSSSRSHHCHQVALASSLSHHHHRMPAIPAPPKTTTRPSPRTPSPAQSSVHLPSDTFETKVSPAPSSIHRTPSDQHCSWARLALPTFSSSHTSRQQQQISYRVFFVTLILFLHRSDTTIIKCLWNTCTKYVGPRRQQTTKRGESAQPRQKKRQHAQLVRPRATEQQGTKRPRSYDHLLVRLLIVLC